MKNKNLQKMIAKASNEYVNLDLTMGFLRYEALRKLTPREFQVLWKRNIDGENFDEMVTELITK